VEFIAPAIVAAAWWGAKVAASTTIDAALDISIAAITGMPPPGAGAHVLNAIANAIPVLGELNTGKKLVKLGNAVQKIMSAVDKLRKIPGGEKMLGRLESLYNAVESSISSGNLGKANEALSKLINE